MGFIPFSVFVYLFSASACFFYGLHFYRAYKKTNNEYFLMFFRLGMLETVSLILYGAPLLIFPQTIIPGIMHIFGTFFNFWGVSIPLKFTLEIWFGEIIGKVAQIIVIAIGIILIITYIPYASIPEISNGAVIWRIASPFKYIETVVGISLTTIPALFFFLSRVQSKKAKIKKFLFAATFFLGGFGGWMHVLTDDVFLINALFATMLAGFIILYLMFFVDVFMKEKPASDAISQ